jgi:hypothetical protein
MSSNTCAAFLLWDCRKRSMYRAPFFVLPFGSVVDGRGQDLMKYKMAGFPNEPLGWKASVIRSEISSRPKLNCASALFVSAPHTNEIPRTDPSVHVDYVRVVDLDIWAGNRTSSRSEWSPFRSSPAELEPATAAGGVGTTTENIESTAVQD